MHFSKYLLLGRAKIDGNPSAYDVMPPTSPFIYLMFGTVTYQECFGAQDFSQAIQW